MKLVPNVVGSQMQYEIGSKCINEEGHKCNKRDRLRITFLVTNVLPRTRVEKLREKKYGWKYVCVRSKFIFAPFCVMSMINDSSPKHAFHQHSVRLRPTTVNICDQFLTTTANCTTFMTHPTLIT